MDIIGFCIPPKDMVFPHLRGEIPGFGTPGERFEQFQQHHVEMKEWGKTFDITIYSIVKFGQLAMENNPNMVDSLFFPRRCVLQSTQIYEHLRENRQLFLHLGNLEIQVAGRSIFAASMFCSAEVEKSAPRVKRQAGRR